MACFIVPGAEAVVTTVIAKVLKKKENAKGTPSHECISGKVRNLSRLLWGGSALLAFEHLWHGEIQPFFPFITALETAGGTAEVLHEMATVGVSMAVMVTAFWGAVTYAAGKVSAKKEMAKE